MDATLCDFLVVWILAATKSAAVCVSHVGCDVDCATGSYCTTKTVHLSWFPILFSLQCNYWYPSFTLLDRQGYRIQLYGSCSYVVRFFSLLMGGFKLNVLGYFRILESWNKTSMFTLLCEFARCVLQKIWKSRVKLQGFYLGSLLRSKRTRHESLSEAASERPVRKKVLKAHIVLNCKSLIDSVDQLFWCAVIYIHFSVICALVLEFLHWHKFSIISRASAPCKS